ncbi:hypothetical protein VT84_37150 [Gemmata sp. SH-PL17]|uniref:TIGR02996 domain-containing protein n=1 Tax=Gemmata sp. SH-PL17 TaxID=1630693 RepID=UPI00078B1AD5|nr:TIGR02996 domain-containing protein [Gemmata sp. SH-PL17]AMV30081.1 hypothetical protein VT84_37150 [Gemmata sp. SH-PL17]
MSERAALLTAIRNHLDDDTPRLVYADWLDEHAVDDRDRATAEFIRASCLGRNHPTGYMPRKAYKWIGEHWRRLLPLTLGHHVPTWWTIGRDAAQVTEDVRWMRSGREIQAHMHLPAGPHAGDLKWHAVQFEFNRGFLQWARAYSYHVTERLRGPILADQPFAQLRLFN